MFDQIMDHVFHAILNISFSNPTCCFHVNTMLVFPSHGLHFILMYKCCGYLWSLQLLIKFTTTKLLTATILSISFSNLPSVSILIRWFFHHMGCISFYVWLLWSASVSYNYWSNYHNKITTNNKITTVKPEITHTVIP